MTQSHKDAAKQVIFHFISNHFINSDDYSLVLIIRKNIALIKTHRNIRNPSLAVDSFLAQHWSTCQPISIQPTHGVIHIEQCAVGTLEDGSWLKNAFCKLSVGRHLCKHTQSQYHKWSISHKPTEQPSETAAKKHWRGKVKRLLWRRWSEEEKKHIWS